MYFYMMFKQALYKLQARCHWKWNRNGLEQLQRTISDEFYIVCRTMLICLDNDEIISWETYRTPPVDINQN